jgi:hypothetical protein
MSNVYNKNYITSKITNCNIKFKVCIWNNEDIKSNRKLDHNNNITVRF